MSRLTIDVTEQQHQSLKALAALQGKTIKEYAIEKLFASDPGEDRALMELTTLLKQRVAEADAGDVDRRSFTEIAETVLNPGTPRE
jgi:hypothetical protein